MSHWLIALSWIMVLMARPAFVEEPGKPARVNGTDVVLTSIPAFAGWTYQGRASKDTIVDVLEKAKVSADVAGEKSDWFRVRTPGGKTGWCLGKYLSADLTVPQVADADGDAGGDEPDSGDSNQSVDLGNDLSWFYTKFGDSTWYPEGRFNIDSFTVEEYRSLLNFAGSKDSQGGAFAALKQSLLPYLRKHPDDPKYQDLEKIVTSKEFLERIPLYDDDIVNYLPVSLSSDREFVLKLAESNRRALEFASPTLRADRSFIALVLKKNVWNFDHVPEAFKDDKELVLEVVKISGLYLSSVSKRLQADKDVVLAAINNNPFALSSASPKLRGNRDIDIECVRQVTLRIAANADKFAWVGLLPAKTWRDKALLLEAAKGLAAAPGPKDCGFVFLLDSRLRKDGQFLTKLARLNGSCATAIANLPPK